MLTRLAFVRLTVAGTAAVAPTTSGGEPGSVDSIGPQYARADDGIGARSSLMSRLVVALTVL